MASKMKAPRAARTEADDSLPVLLLQQINRDSMIQRHMNERKVLGDAIQRRETEQASVMAVAEANEKSRQFREKSAPKEAREAKDSRAAGESKETKESTPYTITYYNPELKKAEVLAGNTEIIIKDPVVKAAEESAGAASAFPIYNYIAEPLMRKEIDPARLERILSEREYGTPPTSGAGASVVPVKLAEQGAREAAESKRMDDRIHFALDTFVIRKEKCEVRLGQEILILESVVSALGKGEKLERAISRLPPLSKARYLLLLRKKRATDLLVINMLARDISFLRNMKKKLTLFTIDDVIGMLKGLRALKK